MKHIIVIFIALMGCLCVNAEVRIHMEKEAGVYKVPCQVNGLKMKFIFDTGAANVSISSTYAEMMLENGYLVESDFKGTTQSILADGSVVDNAVVNLRKVEIAGQMIENVTALVVDSQNAPLLLGQSVIQRLGKVSIDGDYLVIHNANIYTEDEIEAIFNKANDYFSNLIYSEALKYYNIVYDYYGDDTHPGVLLQMGKCYSQIGDKDSAIVFFHKAIDLDDGENQDGVLFEVYQCCYFYYFYIRDYNLAFQNAKLSEKYAINKSDKAEAWAYLGEINYFLNKYADALSYLDKSIDSYNQLKKQRKLDSAEYMIYSGAVLDKGHSLQSLKRFNEAIEMYTLEKKLLEQCKNERYYQNRLDDCNMSLSECYENLANH